MKTIRSLLLLILIWLSVSACSPTAKPAPPHLEVSMKGYELYSWQDGSNWKFSLLPGTNAEKTLDEIKSADTAIAGLDSLTAVLEQLSPGQEIFWWVKDGLALPPGDAVALVEKICREKGLKLDILK